MDSIIKYMKGKNKSNEVHGILMKLYAVYIAGKFRGTLFSWKYSEFIYADQPPPPPPPSNCTIYFSF